MLFSLSRPFLPRSLGALSIVLFAACSGGSDPAEPEPAPARLDVVAGGTAQAAPVGAAVATVPSVRVISNKGEPMAGVTVSFAASGGGSVGSASAQTNAQGVASPGSWTLGTTAGANPLTASVGSLTKQFTATGTPGPVAALAVTSGGGQNGAAGAALAAPVVVQAKDAHGNVVPNATVAFTVASGGGSVAPASAETNASGEAQTVWTLGPTAGTQTLTAAVGAVTASASATATVSEPSPLLAAQVDVGGLAQCARSATGQVSCWGRNAAALVGDGTTTFRASPVPLALAATTFQWVTVGFSNGCALTSAGAAYCWGLGPSIGDGTTADRLAPTAVAGGHVFTEIVVGTSTACALKEDGTAWCWGGTTPSGNAVRTAPTLVSATLRFTDLGAGASVNGTLNDRNCGVATTGEVYCWGIRGIGDPAVVTVDAAQAPAALGGGVTLASITMGRHHACGLAADGQAYCWGLNDYGQVGDGTSGNTRATPVAVAGAARYTSISAGGAHTCGVTTTGTINCWGANDFDGGSGVRVPTGALGNGTTTPSPATSPQPIVGTAGVTFTSVAAGTTSTCAVASNSEVYCWGQRQTDNPLIVYAEPTPTRVMVP